MHHLLIQVGVDVRRGLVLVVAHDLHGLQWGHTGAIKHGHEVVPEVVRGQRCRSGRHGVFGIFTDGPDIYAIALAPEASMNSPRKNVCSAGDPTGRFGSKKMAAADWIYKYIRCRISILQKGGIKAPPFRMPNAPTACRRVKKKGSAAMKKLRKIPLPDAKCADCVPQSEKKALRR